MGKHAQKTVLYTVKCIKCGPQFLKASGLHVLIRAGMMNNSVTFFCPVCSQQRWMLVDKTISDDLITTAEVGWTLVRIPMEALESHFGGPLTVEWVEKAIAGLDFLEWPTK